MTSPIRGGGRHSVTARHLSSIWWMPVWASSCGEVVSILGNRRGPGSRLAKRRTISLLTWLLRDALEAEKMSVVRSRLTSRGLRIRFTIEVR